MTNPSKASTAKSASYQKTTSRPRCLALGLALGLAMMASAGDARAELTLESQRAAAALAAGVGALKGTVSARCWQEGREILAEGDFTSADIGQDLRARALFLQSGGTLAGNTAVVLPIADALCLLTVRP